jgi:hypothetical protein
MKQCTNCGNQYEDSGVFCKYCGSSSDNIFETTPQQSYPPPPQQSYPPPQYQYQQPGADFYNKYHTMGGWLLFFVIANIIGVFIDAIVSISGIFDTFEIIGDMTDSAMGYFLPENFETAIYITLTGEIVGLLTIVFTTMFVVQLFKRKPAFLRYYQLNIFALLFYSIFVGLIPNIMLGYDISFILGNIVGSVAHFFLLTLYYCRSIRVRTFMGSDEYMEKALFAFKNQYPLDRPPTHGY